MKVLCFLVFLSVSVVDEGASYYYYYYERSDGGRWYLYGTCEYYIPGFGETKSFNESKSFCETQNSTLVQPKTEKDQMILKSFKSVVEYRSYFRGEIPSQAYRNPHTFYVGLTKINGSYYWSDGELLNYSNWNTTGGEPSNDTNKSCVVYDYNGDKWKTANCSALIHGFLCQREHVLNLTWHGNGTIEYLFPRDDIRVSSYDAAEQYCKDIGAEIPVVNTDEIRKYLFSTFETLWNTYNYGYFFSRDSTNSTPTTSCSYTHCYNYYNDCYTNTDRSCYYEATYLVILCQRQRVIPWSSWSECSSSCLPGIQTRTRNKPCATNTQTGYCNIDEIEKQSRPCNTHLCKNSLDQTNCDKSKLKVKECATEFLHDIFNEAKLQNINTAVAYKNYKPKDGMKLALKVGSLKKNKVRVQVMSLAKPDQENG